MGGGGAYGQIETLNSEFAENHFPLDDGGNLYKGRRPSESPPEYPSGGKGAGLRYWGTDPLPYVSYEKETNKSEQDWSDVINLTFQLNNSPNETYLEDVGQVVNIEQWLRALAMHEFLNDEADSNRWPMNTRYIVACWTRDSRWFPLIWMKCLSIAAHRCDDLLAFLP